jgi:hypothetical protein
MPQDASTDATQPKKQKKKQEFFRMSPKLRAIISRLKYVGEHLFGGDNAAYAAAVGLSEHWLNRILLEDARLRISMFSQFVESGVVCAEWLFCGSGPMLAADKRKDALAPYEAPTAIAPSCDVLDTTLLVPPPPVEIQPFITPDDYVITKEAMQFLPIVRATYHSRANNKPVILFINDDVICAGVTPIIQTLVKQKIVTHVALTSAAAVADFYAALSTPFDPSGFVSALRIGANHGVGLAETLAKWSLADSDSRDRSILAFAHDHGASVSVHTVLGDTPLHLLPAAGGTDYGMLLGALSYVDWLCFAKKVCETYGDPPGTIIVAGSAKPALQLVSSAMDAGHRFPTPLDFSKVKIARLSNMPARKNLDFFLAGNYRDMFPQFLDICCVVYTSKAERAVYERYGYKLLERKQPNPDTN